MINVTQPFLPPESEYLSILRDIWKRCWLTNNGPVVNELELQLKSYLGLDHLLFTANGTVALQIALKGLGITGQVITTPFSYVATSSVIVWEGCEPVFCDIDPLRLTIDPDRIEALITESTTAILATHVYGIPCDVEKLEAIALRHRLKVIYDGAHCFGTKYKGRSLLAFGDVSTLSTHATKLFHTVEGGAIITHEPELLRSFALLRNFGHDGFDRFSACGINGKNSEFHAAMGLANLKHIDAILAKRREDSAHYDRLFSSTKLTRPRIPEGTEYNFSYYPVIFETEMQCKQVHKALADNNIFARRYFYPSLSHLPYVRRGDTPVADDIASRVLCLPHYFDLTKAEIDMIARIVIRTLRYG